MSTQEEFAYESVEKTAACLRAGRNYLDLSQVELGEKLGISDAAVSRHENGIDLQDNPYARAFLLEEIAKLGCPRPILGLPPFSSLVRSGDVALEEAAIRAEAERAERAKRESPQSDGGTSSPD